VLAVDSNARAVACAREGAAMNGLTNVVAELCASGDFDGKGTFDLVLANPPYYADFRIAGLFVESGLAALRPGGRILVVTKSPDWYRQNMPAGFASIEIERSKDYFIVQAVRGA
jgi:16S rRNA (guanine1207-N2)-methyltransferase